MRLRSPALQRATDGSQAQRAHAHRGRDRRDRRVARRRPASTTTDSPAPVTTCATSATGSSRSSTRSTTASAGSAGERSTTSLRRLDVAPAEIYGVATFYGLFSTTERPRSSGARLRRSGLPDRRCHRSASGAHESPCLGLCERAPAVLLVEAGPEANQTVLAPATPVQVRSLLDGGAAPDEAPAEAATPQVAAGADDLVLLAPGRRRRSHQPRRRTAATAATPRSRRAIEIGPAGVIREVPDSGTHGPRRRRVPRPAASGTRSPRQPRPAALPRLQRRRDRARHVQGPGAHGGRPVRADRGDDHRRVRHRLRAGLHLPPRRVPAWPPHGSPTRSTQARAHGLLGDDVDGRGVLVRHRGLRSAPAPTSAARRRRSSTRSRAIRGEPRNKPPFPVEVGLFGKPTVVNNVETLANVLPIVLGGGPAYASVGTAGSTGTKLFCVSGAVARPGVYEAALRHHAARADRPRRRRARRHARCSAVLLGGAAGVVRDARRTRRAAHLRRLRARRAVARQSGVVMVLDETVGPRRVRRTASPRSSATSRCGQCVPCRVGTVRQQEAVLLRLEHGGPNAAAELASCSRDIGRGHARRLDLRARPDSAHGAIESAIAKLGGLRDVNTR